jgi:hypothetical protein
LPTPRLRSRDEVLATMEAVSQKMEGVEGLDEEISRLRDNPRG